MRGILPWRWRWSRCDPLVFVADDAIAAARDLEVRIEDALAEAFGYPVETFVRAGSEIAEIVAGQPFAAAITTGSVGKPQVTFLRRTLGTVSRLQARYSLGTSG